jgi:hypothetical protein
MKRSIALFDQKSIHQGVIAGVLMALFLCFLSISGNYGSSGLKFFKYLALMAVLSHAFVKVKDKVTGDMSFFKATIKKGFVISLISGFIVTVVNSILFLVKPAYSITKYNLSPKTVAELHLVNAALMVEIVVVGMIASFILFQGLKPKFK